MYNLNLIEPRYMYNLNLIAPRYMYNLNLIAPRYMDTGAHIYGRWYKGRPWQEGGRARDSIELVNRCQELS